MTPENVAYMPTLGRLANIRAIVPYWIEQMDQVRLVVERYEYNDHAKLKREMGWGEKVVIINQPLSGRGIAYVRNFIVKHAKESGQRSIIIAEDDTKPVKGSDFVMLLEEADKPDVVGVGATRSLHDRFTGGAISKLSGAILCPGGWGFQCFSVNVDTVLELGNYNIKLHTIADDAEMAMRGIEAGMPWRVHCDVRMTSGNRYDAGGINTRFSNREQRAAAERECWAIMHKRWPDIVAPPEKKVRVAWQKFYDRYIPEWREYSALHGGSLEAYDNYQPEEE